MFGTLRRQLIVGVALVHAVMMALFIWDLTHRQQEMLLERQTEYATALAQSIATSSSGWLASKDYYGLQEIVRSQNRYPELLFAMILDMRGRIVAHSDISLLNKYVTDLPPVDPKASETNIYILSHTPELVDVISPVILAGSQVGWVRVGLGQKTISARLHAMTRDGILYAMIAIIIGSILAWFMGSRLTKRLYEIQKITDAVQKGDHRQRAHVVGSDEAASLGHAFNAMLDNLSDREAHLHTLIQTLPDLIWLKDPDGVYLACNNRFERFFGARESEIVGKTDYDFVEKTIADSFREKDRNAMSAGKPTINEEEIVYADDGHKEFLETIKTPMHDSKGVLIGVLGIGRDITQRKQYETELSKQHAHLEELVEVRTKELKKARDKAESANKAKSIFLANMSHELRTPMNAVLGFAQLMQRDPNVTREQQENLATIHRSGNHLLELINDVLDISRIETGHIKQVVRVFNLQEFFNGIQEMIQVRTQSKGIAFNLELDNQLPLLVQGDAHKLRQILINLLGNAVKFTSEGSVTLTVSLKSQEQENYRILFEIKDTGLGISAEEQETIFEPFSQADAGEKSGEGSGLGLAISKQFVDLLGGKLQVSSEGGNGAIFYFEIPLVVVSDGSEGLEQEEKRVIGLEPEQPAYRMLIVEDKPDNRLMLRKLLEQVGFEVAEAVNGKEAVTLFKKWLPHVIWMDMRMPIMNGYEATRIIKSTPEGKATIIIAQTASAFEEDRETILKAGCDGFVHKPIQEHEVFNSLKDLLSVRFRYEQDYYPPKQTQLIDVKALSQLSPELHQRLKLAAQELDLEVMNQIVDEIELHAQPLAQTMKSLMKDFKFNLILEALDEVEKDTDGLSD